jgi:hypothetical protein
MEYTIISVESLAKLKLGLGRWTCERLRLLVASLADNLQLPYDLEPTRSLVNRYDDANISFGQLESQCDEFEGMFKASR